MKNDRYKLVGGGDLILDTLAYDNNHEKEGYLLLPHHYYPDDDNPRYYNTMELVDKLNEYDRMVTKDYYADETFSLDLENQIIPRLNSELKQKLCELQPYSNDKFDINYMDMDYNTGEISKYNINVSVSRSDETGRIDNYKYIPTKELDEYTRTSMLLEFEKYINENKFTQEELVLLYGLRARLLSL